MALNHVGGEKIIITIAFPDLPPSVFQGFKSCRQSEVPNFQFHGIINEEVTCKDRRGEGKPTESQM